MSRKKNVLVVVAHADDLEFYAGGTAARFVLEKGYDVYELILTDNSKGSYSLSNDELIEVSAREAVEAGRVLGLKEVRLAGYTDGELDQVNAAELRGRVMETIREVRADIVMGWDPFAPYEDHPDHRAAAMATLEAASFASMPLFYPEHKCPPWCVTEAYWFAKYPWNAETFVEITSTIDLKIQALLKHDCQMDLTIDSIKCEAKAIGADLPMPQKLEKAGYGSVIDLAIRSAHASIGEKAGMEFAEQFRYEKLGLLDRILGMDLITPDF
jgi:LmbE family N-acetylglucosaminyl deacetylase